MLIILLVSKYYEAKGLDIKRFCQPFCLVFRRDSLWTLICQRMIRKFSDFGILS